MIILSCILTQVDKSAIFYNNLLDFFKILSNSIVFIYY